MACYFFYGTLMDAAVRAAVLGRDLPAAAVKAAELAGWHRVRRRGATYPVLVPAASSRTDGIAVDGLTAEDGERLARFEGPDYRLGRVTLALRPRGRIAAWAFLPVTPAIADSRSWDYGVWQRRHRRAFLERIGKRDIAG
jgi:Gamma-glutamyl cyclotransferase, AIG2-like